MSQKAETIEGIGPANAEKLAAAGITTVDQILEKCCDPKGRKAVAEASGVGEKTILTWANMADLMRVKGVGGEFAELLKASGVDTIKELRTRNAANLAVKMQQVNDEKKLTRVVPSEKVVTEWIEQAGGIEPAITH